MADAWKARPVSGEIMTGSEAGRAGFAGARPCAWVDAEFETVSSPANAARPFAAAPVSGLLLLTALRRPDAPRGPTRAGFAFWGSGLLTAAAALWISGGHSLLKTADAAVLPHPRAGWTSEVTSRVTIANGRAVLAVDGAALNGAETAQRLPPILIRVWRNDGSATLYRLGTGEPVVAAGGRYTFSSRVEAPKNLKDISISFGE